MNPYLLRGSLLLPMLMTGMTFSAEALADGHWQGIYVGLVAGYSGIDQDRVIHQTAPPIDFHDSFGSSEALAGVVGGYNYQNGRLILGLEADMLWAPEGRELVDGQPTVVSGSYTDQKWQREVLARAGYDMGAFMPFLAVGAAQAKFETTMFTGSPPIEDPPVSRIHLGITAGAGVELPATENVSVRLEYRFSHFFEQSYTVGIPGSYPVENAFEAHAVRGSVLFRF